jgi:hypothetical protein
LPAVQLDPQHGWSGPPQVPPQEPFAHVPVPDDPQAVPLAMHRFPSQHPPLLQAPPSQQGWPGPPHA